MTKLLTFYTADIEARDSKGRPIIETQRVYLASEADARIAELEAELAERTAAVIVHAGYALACSEAVASAYAELEARIKLLESVATPNRLPDVAASDDAAAHWYHKGWNDCREKSLARIEKLESRCRHFRDSAQRAEDERDAARAEVSRLKDEHTASYMAGMERGRDELRAEVENWKAYSLDWMSHYAALESKLASAKELICAVLDETITQGGTLPPQRDAARGGGEP